MPPPPIAVFRAAVDHFGLGVTRLAPLRIAEGHHRQLPPRGSQCVAFGWSQLPQGLSLQLYKACATRGFLFASLVCALVIAPPDLQFK